MSGIGRDGKANWKSMSYDDASIALVMVDLIIVFTVLDELHIVRTE